MAGKYNFKSIAPVPNGSDFIDIILTRTQRKTPTVVHAGWKISRIRSFYMRKVKFTQQTIDEKLAAILDNFPRFDEIHPFYADLMNVLYDKDHYKLALGQLNTCRHLVQNVQKDYVRMLKYGDTLYRCKQLKRAALGRMMTLLKRQGASFGYLEEVRKHLSRLPAIDPNTRTLILTGYPNVGKSSFMNKITRANVDVQPYAFTTKSLFVGHMDYKYVRWQVIDTPGLLDHPLEDRNTIEMQAITALAHLHCCVLYFVDISEQCGYTIAQQVQLFENIKPLFQDKPLYLVANKIDVVRPDALDSESTALLAKLKASAGPGVTMLPMSNKSEEGVMEVKKQSCDSLLKDRVDKKMKAKKVATIVNRLQVATPVPRDQVRRDPVLPESVRRRKEAEAAAGGGSAKTEEELMGGPSNAKRGHNIGGDTPYDDPHKFGGVFNYKGKDLTDQYMLKNDEWKTDMIPEIMDGKNIADFFDPDIERRLQALEVEEAQQLKQWEAAQAAAAAQIEEVDEADRELLGKIRKQRGVVVAKHRANKGGHRFGAVVARKFRRRQASDIKGHLEALGVDVDAVVNAGARRHKRSRSLSRANARERAEEDLMDGGDEDINDRKRARSKSGVAARNQSKVAPRDVSGMPKNKEIRKNVEKLRKRQQKELGRAARKGEGDRTHLDMKPKWLYSGKTGLGTRDWR